MSRLIGRDKAVVVFAREPRLGKVKTRLQENLPAQTVLGLYRAFVKDVLRTAKQVKEAEHFLYYAGTLQSKAFLSSFKRHFILKRQIGKDLGQRMGMAFSHCCSERIKKVVIIGTDCLTLNADDILKAFLALDRHDCVLGPTYDGGYYLIGLKEPERRVFDHVDWGTNKVLVQTLRNLKKLKKTSYQLKMKDDIDTIDDLIKFSRMRKRFLTARCTAQTITKLKLFRINEDR